MEYKEPEVTLVSATDNPLLAIYTGWKIMTDPDWPKTSEVIKDYLAEHVAGRSCDVIPDDELKRVFHEALASPRKGVLEYVHFMFLVENVSRAFQQQLTRHRIGFSYSIQSLRMVDPGKFATEQNYHTPQHIRKDPSQNMDFHMAMTKAQAHYISLTNGGAKPEDARGTLPLNIFSPITFGCTYLALFNLCSQRMCPSTQGEFRQVVKGILNAVQEWNEDLDEGFAPFCDPYRRCLVPKSGSETGCGRWGIQWDGHRIGADPTNQEPNRGIDLFAE